MHKRREKLTANDIKKGWRTLPKDSYHYNFDTRMMVVGLWRIDINIPKDWLLDARLDFINWTTRHIVGYSPGIQRGEFATTFTIDSIVEHEPPDEDPRIAVGRLLVEAGKAIKGELRR